MGKGKLRKFAELARFPHVFENFSHERPELIGKDGEVVDFRGRWSQDFFGNGHPLVLELACGRGEYTVELARRYPGRNFIGIDIKGARLWAGARQALEEGLANVAFVRTRIEHLGAFFGRGEVSAMWITFPDPFPRKSKANKRLTSPYFLDLYRGVLTAGAELHLKTDSEILFRYTLEVLSEREDYELEIRIDDIDAGARSKYPDLDICTYYERMHMREGRSIKYVRWRFRGVDHSSSEGES